MELAALLPSIIWRDSTYWFSMYQGRWGILFFGLAAIIAVWLKREWHWSIGLFWFIAMVSGIRSFAWAFIAPEASYSVALIALATLAILATENARIWFRFITAACAIAVAWTFFDPGAYSGNPSMNGTLIAFSLPVALWHLRARPSVWCLLMSFGIISVFWVDASIPVGVLVVAAAAYAWASLGRFRHAFAGIAAIGIVAFGLGFALSPATFFSSTGRFESYARVLSWFYHSGHWAFGHGLGSYAMISNAVARSENYFLLKIWAHSDWLQILFELGIVGLTSAFALFYYTLKKSFRRPWLFASIAAYGAAMLFNFPNHLPVHALIGWALLWFAWV